MKKIIITFGLFALIAGLTGCKKDGIDQDTSFVSSATISNNGKVFKMSDDNSGNVTITPTGEGISYSIIKFGHGSGAAAEAKVMGGYSAMHAYPEGNYTVTITSKSFSRQEVTTTYPLQVIYRAPENIKITATTNLHNIKVKASAKYGVSYMVYFGDVTNETGTPLAKGAEVSHDYATAATYNVKVVAFSAGAAKSEQTTAVPIYDPFRLPITFDLSTQNPIFGVFGKNQKFAIVNNPNPSGINTSATVGMFTRGEESWSGTYSPLNVPIDMSVGKVIRVLAYNPDPALIGKKLNVELEKGSSISDGIAVLKTAFTTSGAWEELVFDFSTNPGIPANEKFSQLVLRFNDSSDGPGAVIYVDNFRLTN